MSDNMPQTQYIFVFVSIGIAETILEKVNNNEKVKEKMFDFRVKMKFLFNFKSLFEVFLKFKAFLLKYKDVQTSNST